MRSLSATALVLTSVAIACGGQIELPKSDSGLDGGLDSGFAFEGGIDAGPWTQCSSPQGYTICRGPANCPEQCCDDLRPPSETGNAVGVCLNHAITQFDQANGGRYGSCQGCRGICVAWRSGAPVFFCAPYELGVLFAQAGAADRVRYADLGLWRNQPIPTTASVCPAPTSGITFCGPGCGDCTKPNEVCAGRSPLHPTGFCTNLTRMPLVCGTAPQDNKCGAGDACFTFTVEPAAQAIADKYGYCMTVGECSALAGNLPGGGKCAPSQ